MRTGGDVRFGVWMRILWDAWAKRVRRKVFSGVGGAVVEERRVMGWKLGLRWCGEGRNMVGMVVAVDVEEGNMISVWAYGIGLAELCASSAILVSPDSPLFPSPGPTEVADTRLAALPLWAFEETGSRPSSSLGIRFGASLPPSQNSR